MLEPADAQLPRDAGAQVPGDADTRIPRGASRFLHSRTVLLSPPVQAHIMALPGKMWS